MLIEAKSSSLVVHYRQAPHCEKAVRALVAALAAEDRGAEVLPALMAFELRPRGVDKGQALRRLMHLPPFAGRLPVFAGDDVTDEAAIAAARALGGVGLHVAQDFAAGAASVRAWLAASAASLQGETGHGRD